MSTSPLVLSIVLSFRNEAQVIPELVDRLRGVLGGEKEKGRIFGYELIFVNDDSTDDSLEILKREDAGHGDIRIINMSRNFGVSPCVLAGMEYSRGDLVVYMDADLQDPPEVISEMLNTWNADRRVDVIHTHRISRDGEGMVKLMLTRLGYVVLQRVTSIRLQPETGDFKMMTRRVVAQIVNLREKRPFMRGLVNWVGFRHVTISYHREPRAAGETKFPVLSYNVISNFLGSALISFSSFPLRIAAFFSLICALIGAGVMAHVLLEKFLGHNIPGWTAIMVTVLFIGSAQLLCISILGLYILNIFESATRRPNYIVESSYGFEPECDPAGKNG